MAKRRKVRAKKIWALSAFAIVFIITCSVHATFRGPNNFFFLPSANVDSPPPAKQIPTTKDSSKPVYGLTTDTLRSKQDTTPRDSIVQTIDSLNVKLSKDSLDAPVNYSAEDSGVLIIPTKEFILYGKAKAKYNDIQVTANTIELNQETQLLKAYGSTDTTGNPQNKPKLVQGESTSISDSIFYNTKTQKGLTKSSYLQEGEMFVYAQTVKKINANTLYAYKGRFTTCNLDTPHFAFRSRKMKIINNQMAISGPTSVEFEGVPIPIGIPFGIFPLNRDRHSGLLPPQFANNEQTGIGLEGLGYYKVLSENFDLTARTNIYSYGGWFLGLNSRYLKRYKYNGNINISIQNTKILNTGALLKTEFTTSKNFLINWSHSRDTKARPGSNFSANVNFGSAKYNQFVTNNSAQNFQNQLSSSITYSRDWRGKYNLSMGLNHSQNNNTRLVNLILPTASFNVVTFYPFQKKESVGTPKWYEKLGVGYSGNFINKVDFYDSAFSLRRLLDTAQYGATHSIPITLSLPQLGPIQISPSVSYEEHWYGQKVLLRWDSNAKKVDTSISRGIYTARQMAFGIAANTRIFGTLQFKKSKGIQAIRHEIRPNISLNYRPDMNKNTYYNFQSDTFGNIRRRSQYEGSIVSPFGEGRFGGVGFGVDNTLEMKVKNRKDTSDGDTKKVRLLDGFGFNGSYNLIPGPLDSFPMSNFSLYARSNLFEKINITANANLDPYRVDTFGLRQAKLKLPGRITNGSLAISTSFQSKNKDEKKDKDRIIKDDYQTPDEQQRQLDYVRSNPAEYTDFNIPWTVQLSYSLSFSRLLTSNFDYVTRTFSNLSVNGDFSLTPRWKMGGNTYYDFTTKKIQTLTMFITREMHCWQMSINITPVGLFRSFSISINPKSGILRDLKINRSRYFYQ